MKQFLRVSFFVSILVALASVAIAHKIDYGLQAYNAGDYKKAYQIWLPEAEKGGGLEILAVDPVQSLSSRTSGPGCRGRRPDPQT